MKPLLFINLFLLAFTINGQNTIKGNVRDPGGEAVIGANVYLLDTYDGATTDIEGNFNFETFETGSQTLIVSFIGFHEYQKELTIGRDEELQISLKEKIDELNAVVISAGSFNASDEAKKVIMKSVDVVTTAGATADIAGALNTLPGTQTVGETGRLFVRGGDGYETKTFIDGMVVHNEYSPSAPNTPSRSRFSPFIFKGTSFSTGGYSAEYGQALSSALILDSKDVAAITRSDISLMSVGADVAHTHVWDRSSFSGKVSYSNLTPYFELMKQRLKWDKAPEEWMGNFAYRKEAGNSGLLKLYGNFSTATLDLFQEEIGDPTLTYPVGIDNDYSYLNAVYRDAINAKWAVKLGIADTRSFQKSMEGDNGIENELTGNHVKAVLLYTPSDRINLQAGGEVLRTENVQKYLADTSTLRQSYSRNIMSSHIETEGYISKDLVIRAGGRFEFNSLNKATNVSPRLSLAIRAGEHGQVSFAHGRFYQSAPDQYLFLEPNLDQERSTHWITNYQWSTGRRTFRAEAYRKTYDHLVKGTSTDLRNTGDGYATGFDLWWRDGDTFDGLDYWISYSFLDTERDYRDYPGRYTPGFASKHNLSVVFKKWIERITSQVGATYTFSTPRAYTDLNMEGFQQARTPSFHDLSVNISYLMNSQVIVHALVNNVLGVNNVFGYEYAGQPDGDGIYARRAITPAAKRFFFIGVFITLSKVKSINQLPNL